MIAKYKKNKNINNKDLNLKTGNSIRDFTNAEKIAEIIFKLSKKKLEVYLILDQEKGYFVEIY